MLPRYFYYVDLALRSFRRNRVLTGLMVLAIALGVGASMTTLTVLYLLSGDPMPGKSDRLHLVQLDAAGKDGFTPGAEPDEQLTRSDAEALLRAKRADRQAMMTGGDVVVDPGRADLEPFFIPARYSTTDFFPMFGAPFAYGSAWAATDDDGHARVAVLSKELNEKLFGGVNSVGRSIRIDQTEFRIVGVMATWRPTPHFYDLNTARFDSYEQVFLPFSTSRELKFGRSGNMSCWDDPPGDSEDLGAPCTWIQFWVELGTPEKAADYRAFLVSYAQDQHKAGVYARPPNERLRNVMEWLDYKRVVPSDVRLQTWLAFGFLLVCLVNTIGLLLAKFLRRSSEIGVRRALGASRRAIFAQFLVEAATVGLAGGALGLGLAWLGLWAVRNQPTEYASIARLDPIMLATTFVLALAASLLAGLVPAWRACQVAPALQLKSQ